jgi:hypothetical protein
MEEINKLARQIWGQDVSARLTNGGVRIESFKMGEVLVVRHPDRELARKMVLSMLLWTVPGDGG